MIIPGYWRHETTGVLAPAVMAYLEGHAMDPGQFAAMRAYLRQWMAAPWDGEIIPTLRTMIDAIDSRTALHDWLVLADSVGIDPL